MRPSSAVLQSTPLRLYEGLFPQEVKLNMKIVGSIADDLESGIDNFVSLKSRDENVEDPEEDENGSSDDFWSSWASKLTTNGWVTTDHQDGNSQAGFNTENGDGEAQAGKRE